MCRMELLGPKDLVKSAHFVTISVTQSSQSPSVPCLVIDLQRRFTPQCIDPGIDMLIVKLEKMQRALPLFLGPNFQSSWQVFYMISQIEILVERLICSDKHVDFEDL